MASLLYIQENNLLNAPNVNLLPNFAMFNDAFTWNVVSGSATASNIDQQQLEGERCLRINPVFSSETVVNSGGSQMSFEIVEDGNHIFSIRHKAEYSSSGATTEIRVRIYIDGVPTNYSFFGDNQYNGEYRTYFAIIPSLTNGNVIDFDFQFMTSDIGGTRKNYFDAFKFEYDSYGLSTPTTFSLPVQRTLSTTQTIDVPSISSNSYYAVVVTLEGAEIGDYVTMTYPSEIITLGLIVGYPIVTDVDEVSFLIYNHSGGAINPASGSYTFKIVK